jgi:hypothetical protein
VEGRLMAVVHGEERERERKNQSASLGEREATWPHIGFANLHIPIHMI